MSYDSNLPPGVTPEHPQFNDLPVDCIYCMDDPEAGCQICGGFFMHVTVDKKEARAEL